MSPVHDLVGETSVIIWELVESFKEETASLLASLSQVFGSDSQRLHSIHLIVVVTLLYVDGMVGINAIIDIDCMTNGIIMISEPPNCCIVLSI